MKPASEILNVSIGGFTSMRLEFLKSASKPGGARIPCNWSSNRCYEELQHDGLVIEGPRAEPLRRHWMATDAGRAYLDQQLSEKP